MLLPIWAQMQPWIYWKFVEEPDFGSGPEIHTVLFMTNVNVEEDVSTIGKWVTSEYAWSQLMAGKKETDARLGPLAAFAFSPHFPQSLRHRLKLSMNVQEYPPGVLVLPLKSATLKPFSKTNLVAFSSMGMLDQGAVTGLRGESLIVDPGCHPRDAQDALSMVVKSLPKKMFIFLTHHHLDHTEGLPTVYKENPEAVILAHELTIKRLGKVAKKLKCIPIADGMTIIIGSEELQVIAAPGHTDGHMALLHVLSHTLIVGDHCVGQGSSRLDATSGGNMKDYLATTRTFIRLAPRVIIPMHGKMNLWPLEMLKGYIRHREDREAKILSCINQGAHTAFEIVSQAYADAPPAVWPAALSNAILHVDHLKECKQLPEQFSMPFFRRSCGLGFFMRCMACSSFTRLKALCRKHQALWKASIISVVIGGVWIAWKR
ncbi:hypothetical protein KP509_01G043600 [Ceratopteris richardii]|nr:hypothetical protein KP509_01G043600 [Ceratopteris richardii]